MLGAQAGCFVPRGWDPGGHSNAYVVDAVIVSIGMMVYYATPSRTGPSCECPGFPPLGVPAMAVGAFGALVNWGLSGDWTYSGGKPPDPTPADDAERDARAAASAGNCPAVHEAMARLLRRDSDRAGQVMTSPAVRACFQ
jgi:hypothetical protein